MSDNQNSNYKKLLLNGLNLPFDAEDEDIIAAAAEKMKRVGIYAPQLHFRLYKKSFDARKRKDIRAVCSVIAENENGFFLDSATLLKLGAKPFTEEALDISCGNESLKAPPLIVGMGPAGLFCAMLLAENGYEPILIDRGGSVEERITKTERFIKYGILDENNNIQFGAGGAGTFSDGKLLTRINDDKCAYVLSSFRKFGAPEEIMTNAKPHIGTDVLRGVVSNMLAYIREAGGKTVYNCKLDGLKELPCGTVEADTNYGKIDCGALVLAIGHSARDTFGLLSQSGFLLKPKDFSIGLRIEHLREDINRAMFGSLAGHPKLKNAEYAISDTSEKRGVYTFCMCPGGEVIAAASETGGVVVNGMSKYARDGINSNSAVAATVFKEDYGADPLLAIEFQRKIETAAFEAGGKCYAAPIQTVGDFLAGVSLHEPTKVLPTYPLNVGVKNARLDLLLPDFTVKALKRGLYAFNEKINGFAASDALLTGVETRTSSPVRIERDERLCAVGHDRIYPCGEGAGYSGGITSSAVDGIRIALEIMKRFAPTTQTR